MSWPENILDDEVEIDEDSCPECGHEHTFRRDCSCDEFGFSYHDCGDDSCCCRYPENNVVCDECGGKGYLHWCHECGHDMTKKEGEK